MKINRIIFAAQNNFVTIGEIFDKWLFDDKYKRKKKYLSPTIECQPKKGKD